MTDEMLKITHDGSLSGYHDFIIIAVFLFLATVLYDWLVPRTALARLPKGKLFLLGWAMLSIYAPLVWTIFPNYYRAKIEKEVLAFNAEQKQRPSSECVYVAKMWAVKSDERNDFWPNKQKMTERSYVAYTNKNGSHGSTDISADIFKNLHVGERIAITHVDTGETLINGLNVWEDGVSLGCDGKI
ncbi:hypothetical protein [Acetobacter persici]|uniref:Uncharacterized protein n=1 Tax=Acetobacter persici TaxID=1076596 RepID=A0A1U9LJD6_9PROT|nr:hypothetical protein [Acetobacter persici]AQT06541.1 hypothetical protein A0U91_16165 [Acetobacter persici]